MEAEPVAVDDPWLPVHECWALLRAHEYGRLAVTGPDGPEIFPINVTVGGGSLVFKTAGGAKLDALRDDPRVAFEVDGIDEATDEVWSVVLRGTASTVSDQYEAVDVVELGVTPWQQGSKPEYVRITPTSVTGVRFRRNE